MPHSAPCAYFMHFCFSVDSKMYMTEFLDNEYDMALLARKTPTELLSGVSYSATN